MGRCKKHSHFNQVPKYVSSENINESCTIYALKYTDENIHHIEACYSAIKIIRRDGNNSIIEDTTEFNASSFFIQLRTGSVLPDTKDGCDICWYDDDCSLDDVMVICTI